MFAMLNSGRDSGWELTGSRINWFTESRRVSPLWIPKPLPQRGQGQSHPPLLDYNEPM